MSMCRPASRKAPASGFPAKARRALNGGPAGDLYIFLSVAEHPIFQRDGHDLHCRAPVSFVTAALGGSDRSADPGRRPRQGGDPRRHPAGAAIPPARPRACRCCAAPSSGDLYVEVAVETPVKLCKRQKELLREFESESQAGCQPEAEGFLAKLKEFWNGGENA